MGGSPAPSGPKLSLRDDLEDGLIGLEDLRPDRRRAAVVIAALLAAFAVA